MQKQTLPQRARKFKKVQVKKLVKSNIANFFSLNCISGSFKLFSSSKIDFWPFLKLQKNGIWPKKNLWNWFIWFHEFFYLDFFKFSGSLCVTHIYYLWKKLKRLFKSENRKTQTGHKNITTENNSTNDEQQLEARKKVYETQQRWMRSRLELEWIKVAY